MGASGSRSRPADEAGPVHGGGVEGVQVVEKDWPRERYQEGVKWVLVHQQGQGARIRDVMANPLPGCVERLGLGGSPASLHAISSVSLCTLLTSSNATPQVNKSVAFLSVNFEQNTNILTQKKAHE